MNVIAKKFDKCLHCLVETVKDLKKVEGKLSQKKKNDLKKIEKTLMELRQNFLECINE